MPKTKRQGRPELPNDAKRRHKVAVRLTDNELAGLQKEADEQHVALSVWLRQRVFRNGATANA